MPSNILLYIAQEISQEDFQEKAIAIKAVDVSEVNETRFNLQRDSQNIWFSIDSYSIPELEEPALANIKAMIGGTPKTCINIEIRRVCDGERLAVELANYLLQHYTGVLLGVTRSVYYSRLDLAKMLLLEQEPNID